MGYKYTIPTNRLGERGMLNLNLNSLSEKWEQARASHVNPTVRDNHNNSLTPQKLKQLPSRRETE